LPVLEVSRGRAFILFTSLRALEKARGLLIDAFKFRGWDYPLLVQGDAPKNELLARFQKAGNAVLLGSQSFWEGVDMPGDVLSVVIIDKLPFQPPDDPVVAARIAQAEKNGGKPFMDYQLPRGDQFEAGGGAADPYRDRSRRADDLRYAAGGQALWALVVECAAGDDADEEAGSGGAVFCFA
jgi:hypothetical protein